MVAWGLQEREERGREAGDGGSYKRLLFCRTQTLCVWRHLQTDAAVFGLTQAWGMSPGFLILLGQLNCLSI